MLKVTESLCSFTRALNLSLCLVSTLTVSTAYAQNNGSSAVCTPFSHSHLFCGQYIQVNTPVYIDDNVFDYTEANRRPMEYHRNMIFGMTTSCRWIAIYTMCLSIYPPCNITTQALLAPCVDECLNHTNNCNNLTGFSTFLAVSDIELDNRLILNCSAPFREYGSVNVDTDNCYKFNFLPQFAELASTTIQDTFKNTSLVVLPNQNLPAQFCSNLQSQEISVYCRAIGIPIPQVDIDVHGNYNIITRFSRQKNELLLMGAPIRYGDVVMFECKASTEKHTSNILVNLTYTCCMDDNGTAHSIGQPFVTTDGHQCFCGNGGNITCDRSRPNTGAAVGIIAVITVVPIIMIIAIIMIMILVCWLRKRTQRHAENVTASVSLGTDKPNSMQLSTATQKADNAENEWNKHAESYLCLKSSAIHLRSSTAECIKHALSKHQLQNFLISSNHLNILELLGEGSFGQVYYGLLTNEADQSVVEVAIKTIKAYCSEDELDLFIAESVIMKKFKHENILSLIGVSVGIENDNARPYIVLPFMPNKDLKKYLQCKRREAEKSLEALLKIVNYSTLVKMCCNICHGMEYLASIKYVHRDLAARNCMVDKDLTIKIADFGLSKDIYCDDYYRTGDKAKVPIKWMPPESIYDRYFDEKTDVWSFGIVCWEVFSFGKQPYPGVQHQHILQHIESGNRLPQPALCGDEMYQIMLKCWHLKNSDRPTFSELLEEFKQYSDAVESDNHA